MMSSKLFVSTAESWYEAYLSEKNEYYFPFKILKFEKNFIQF